MEKKSDVVQNMALFCRVTATGDGMCQDTVFLREATSQSLSLLKTLRPHTIPEHVVEDGESRRKKGEGMENLNAIVTAVDVSSGDR